MKFRFEAKPENERKLNASDSQSLIQSKVVFKLISFVSTFSAIYVNTELTIVFYRKNPIVFWL